MKLKCFLTAALSAVLAVPALAEDGPWVMPVPTDNLAPFKHRKNGKPGGIEVEIAKAITEEAGVDLEFTPLSVGQGRKAFAKGQVTVDCCLNPIWFPDEQDKAVQVFSAPVYSLMEIWFFPKRKSFPIRSTKDLKDKRVAGIEGFHYPGEEDFGQRVNGKTVSDVLNLLTNGQADVAVLERHAARHAIEKQLLDVEFGPYYYDVKVSLRLHKSLEKWLPKINLAVDELKTSGQIDRIIKENSAKY